MEPARTARQAVSTSTGTVAREVGWKRCYFVALSAVTVRVTFTSVPRRFDEFSEVRSGTRFWFVGVLP
ncbi:hypothetical protein Pmi06nite_80450 [Planotetraspora mira]|uniref:Uncharacterized protein n=1 Tax=Planotetraspora mira TaxID=58121 RepID=A0A8J3TXT5_9ACTN|nr:hypothetical protein Pmi06nite_80450 [Planotetraspora mira]